MCLEHIQVPSERREWLDKKPETFTVYKVVRKYQGAYYPLFKFRYNPFKKISKLTKAPPCRIASYSLKKQTFVDYIPYYHIFVSIKGARKFKEGWRNRVIVKCKIRKKDVKTVGRQWKQLIVVVSRFEILQEVE